MKRTFLTSEAPEFFPKLNEAVTSAWSSLGNIACKIEKSEKGYKIMFYPSLREIYGGNEDGENIYSGFNFNVGKFVQVFDEFPAPKVEFVSLEAETIIHLMFRGHINHQAVKVAILSSPPPGQKPVERFYTSGPDKGKVVTLTPPQ